ncbi:hypothetical protein BR93DRAFT_500012 [Coniochaeta sp. PMI_546]|nr:hypothetical protein BR93DRAFT_500012 [Coniochaeta sp. PMI_546]
MILLRVPMLAAALGPGLNRRGAITTFAYAHKHPSPLQAITATKFKLPSGEHPGKYCSKAANPPRRSPKKKKKPLTPVLSRDLPHPSLGNQVPCRGHGYNAVEHLEPPCRCIIRRKSSMSFSFIHCRRFCLFRDKSRVRESCPSSVIMYSICVVDSRIKSLRDHAQILRNGENRDKQIVSMVKGMGIISWSEGKRCVVANRVNKRGSSNPPSTAWNSAPAIMQTQS